MIEQLTDLARQRQSELDSGIAHWRQSPQVNPVRLWCGARCGNCCTLAVNATLPEALAIAAGLDAPVQQRLADAADRIIAHAQRSRDTRGFLAGYRTAVGPCPFLDANANCAIYARRPLACRALLSTRPADWCGINLAELPEYERDPFLASLDRKVVAFPTHYAAAPQELAAAIERGLIFAMFRFAGFGLTGNLPLLVDLARQAECGKALAGGPAAFRRYLSDRRVDHPFLVQFHEP